MKYVPSFISLIFNINNLGCHQNDKIFKYVQQKYFFCLHPKVSAFVYFTTITVAIGLSIMLYLYTQPWVCGKDKILQILSCPTSCCKKRINPKFSNASSRICIHRSTIALQWVKHAFKQEPINQSYMQIFKWSIKYVNCKHQLEVLYNEDMNSSAKSQLLFSLPLNELTFHKETRQTQPKAFKDRLCFTIYSEFIIFSFVEDKWDETAWLKLFF